MKASAVGAGLRSVPGVAQRALVGGGIRGLARQDAVLVAVGSATARLAKVEIESICLN
jgi:hypothetical protein